MAKNKITLPDYDWKSKICPICGIEFDFLEGQQPRTCNDGLCKYKYRFKIDEKYWYKNKKKLDKK